MLIRKANLPFFVLLCSLLWGSAFPVIKTIYGHWAAQGITVGLSDIWLFAGIRFIIAGCLLLPFAKAPFKELKASPLHLVLGLALTQTVIQYVFFYWSIFTSSSTLTSLLVATGSLWWVVLAPLILKTPLPNKQQWLALTVGFAGVTLAVYAPGASAGNPLLGGALMLTATFGGACAIILFQYLSKTMGARAATGYSLIIGGSVLTLLGSPQIGQIPQLFDSFVMLWTLWLAFVSAAAFSLWNHLSTLFSVNLLATYRFLIPICGITESLLFLPDETAGWGLIIGGTLVIGATIAAQRLKDNGQTK